MSIPDVVRGTLLMVLAAVLIACSPPADERPLRYLETVPEYGLAFPQAKLTSSGGTPEEWTVEGPIPAHTAHSYLAPALGPDIAAWYDDQLTLAGWRSTKEDGNGIYHWHKDFVELQLETGPSSSEDATNYTTPYTATLWAKSLAYDPTPLVALKTVPELTLADPGSTLTYDKSVSGRYVGEERVRPASIERRYDTTAPVSVAIEFFEGELSRRGWQIVDPPSGDLGVGVEPDRVWRKDDVVAGLTIRPQRADPSTSTYSFRIAEVPDVEPGLPWK